MSLVIAERGNTEDKQLQIPKTLPLTCIYRTSLASKKVSKPDLTMLNIFDLLPSLMQTDNYLYFLLSIDTRAGFFFLFMNVPDNIKAKFVPTRTLCDCSLVSNFSQFQIYAEPFWLETHKEKRMLLKECIYCFQSFHFPWSVCIYVFERRSTADFFFFFLWAV